jgi:hypothetical protein
LQPNRLGSLVSSHCSRLSAVPHLSRMTTMVSVSLPPISWTFICLTRCQHILEHGRSLLDTSPPFYRRKSLDSAVY